MTGCLRSETDGWMQGKRTTLFALICVIKRCNFHTMSNIHCRERVCWLDCLASIFSSSRECRAIFKEEQQILAIVISRYIRDRTTGKCQAFHFVRFEWRGQTLKTIKVDEHERQGCNYLYICQFVPNHRFSFHYDPPWLSRRIIALISSKLSHAIRLCFKSIANDIRVVFPSGSSKENAKRRNLLRMLYSDKLRFVTIRVIRSRSLILITAVLHDISLFLSCNTSPIFLREIRDLGTIITLKRF